MNNETYFKPFTALHALRQEQLGLILMRSGDKTDDNPQRPQPACRILRGITS